MRAAINAGIFLSGVICGVAGCYFYMKNKYEAGFDSNEENNAEEDEEELKQLTLDGKLIAAGTITEEDIDYSFVGSFSADGTQPTISADEYLNLRNEATEIIKYNSYSSSKTEEETDYHNAETFVEDDVPYVIARQDLEDFDDYSFVDLFYVDGALIDINGNTVSDIEGTIGEKNLAHMGEYEDGVLYIRNDSIKTNYQITEGAPFISR